MNKATVPQSSYPNPYIPALNNLWCHTGNIPPEEREKYINTSTCDIFSNLAFVLTFKFKCSKTFAHDLCVQMKWFRPCWWCGWRRRRAFSHGACGSSAPSEHRAPQRSSCSWTEPEQDMEYIFYMDYQCVSCHQLKPQHTQPERHNNKFVSKIKRFYP